VCTAALLALRDNENMFAAMDKHDIGAIDLVVVNPFIHLKRTVAKGAGNMTR